MQNRNSLKNAFVWMAMFFVSVCVCGSFVSCDKDDFTGHDNSGNAVMSVKAEKRDTTPEPVYRDSSWVKVSNDTITIVVEHFRNDTLINADSVKCNFGASIKRTENKVQTTEARLANLDFSFGEVTTSRNGRNQFVGKQQATDEDGQTYNGEALSGYCTLGSLKDVHAELVSFKKTNLQNTELEPGKDEAKLVNTNIAWVAIVRIVNAPNLEGKTFELTTNSTEHLRVIPENAPELLKTDTTMIRRPDVWFTNWDLIIKETWSNDSVAEKKKTVRTSASVEPITLEDKFVSSFDYSYTNNDLAWGAWKAIQSNDNAISLEEQEGTKLGNASNGYSADAFDTKYVAKRQRATVLFGGYTWNIPAEKVTLSTTRKVFMDQTSDLNGYSMVKFVNDEIARYNNANEQTLTESCKLYLKLTPIELDKIEFVGTKVHTEGMAKIDGSVIPVFTDGSKGGAIEFKFEKAESWTWLKDSVIFNDVNFVMEETGKLTLKGEEKKTAKTFATSNDDITIKCNQYDADFQVGVKVDGGVKYTTWHATWYEDFKVVYNNKSVSLTKSSYSVKNQNDKLSKDEAKSSATSEVWGYSVDGIFSIDEDSRSAMGYGRLTKAIEELVVKIYWDETTKGQSHTVLASTRWATLIREYNTGKKTSQEYKHVFNRLSKASTWEISAEEGSEKAANSLTIENASEESRTDGFAHFTLKKFDLGQFFNVPGAAQQKDEVTFTESMGVYFEVKDQDGNPIKVFFEDPSYSFNNNVKNLVVVKEATEADPFTQYKHENVVNWNFGGATTTVSATGLINVEAQFGGGEPDFDLEIGSIYATVSRPSNRNASDITAYTYLLVSKDGKKCLPFGIYHDVITEGKITDWNDNVYGKGHAYNGACYVKDANQVVATYSVAEGGFVKWYGDNKIIDTAKEITLQGAGFNDSGNNGCINYTGKYAPTVVKKGKGIVEVQFSGTSKTYTFRGWDVK